MPRLTKAQIATLRDNDLLQGVTDAAKLHQELQAKQDNCDIQKEHEILFKQGRKIRQMYYNYRDVLLTRCVDASETGDAEYLKYYTNVLQMIPPLY
jgi:hypothetical protein